MPLSATATAVIRDALAAAAHGERGRAVRQLALRYGVSTASIYRYAQLGGTPRPRDPARPEYREWTQVAEALRHRAPQPAPLDLALESAIAGELLPPEAAAMPVGTAHRIAREVGLRPRPRRTQRLHADYPMQAVQFDGSTSQHLTVGEQIADDDWVLHLHHAPTPAGGYKNKPLAAHRLRLMSYGLWDMCTGYRRSLCLPGLGEAAADSVIALVNLLTETGDPQRPLHGIPDNLWVDQGALFKAAISRDLIDRLGIALVTGKPYNKERQGGVEQGWRRQWQRFERSLFLTGAETITLQALSARLIEYERRENGKRLARVPVGDRMVSRTAAWAALVRTRPDPLRAMPDNAISTLHREDKRRIDRSGIVRWRGAEYECREWHDCWVVARQGLDAPDMLILEDSDGNRAEARRYQPRGYGEVRGIPTTALDKLLEQTPPVGADPYAPVTGQGGGNIVPLRGIAAAAFGIDNPLDASRYGDMDAAISAFCGLYPYPLSAADRKAVEQRIAGDGLSRRAVADLASTLLATVMEISI